MSAASIPERVNQLIAELQSADDAVRGTAWQGAAPLGAPAVKPLAALMGHADFEVARSAKRALWRIVRHAGRPKAAMERQAVQAELVTLLVSAATTVRQEALWMLSEIGDAGTLPQIARLLEKVEVREAARCALERIPGSKATRVLEDAMKSAPDDFRSALAHSLNSRGRKGTGRLPQKPPPRRETSVKPKPV